jgi:hypothetical protein
MEIINRKNWKLKKVIEITEVRNITTILQKYISPDFLCNLPPLGLAKIAVKPVIKQTIPTIT